MQPNDSQTIIDNFFNALRLMQLEQCEAHLAALAQVAIQEPLYQDWCDYLRGILTEQFYSDWAEAERLFRALLERPIPAQMRGRVLNSLGITYRRQGRWADALRAYQQGLALYDQPAQQFERAKIWKNMASTLEIGYSQGDFAASVLNEAVQHCQAALAALQAIPNLNDEVRWWQSITWNTLGVIQRNRAEWEAAIASFEQSIDLAQQVDDRYGVGMATSNIGEIRQRQGPEYWPQAEAAFLDALSTYQEFDHIFEQIDVLSNLGSLQQARVHFDAALDWYEQAIAAAETIRAQLTAPTTQADFRTTMEQVYLAPLAIHLQRGDAAQAFDVSERARSRVLATLLADQSPEPHGDIPPDLLAQRSDLAYLLDNLYATDSPPDNLPDLEAALAQVDRQIELLDPAYAGLRTVTALTAADIQARLASDAALLAYTSDGDDRLWALVLTQSTVQAVAIENLTITWLADFLGSHLSGQRSGLLPSLTTGHLAPPRLFASLYKTLLGPVLGYLELARTIYIIPFGPLHYVPLAALSPQPTIDPPLLAGGKRVIYAPSATILFNYCQSRPQSAQQGTLVIAPADDALQFTIGIATTVTGLAQTNAALTDHQATRQQMLEQAGQYRLICFMGHAYFDQRHPMSSRLKLADGNLYASDILRQLRLEADLVLLTACETGRSQILRGDEILGLTRAMLYAGTPSLLVTLWPVHEIPTRLLVEKLLHLLHETDYFDPAAALAQAQLWLRSLSFVTALTSLTAWPELSASEAKRHLTELWHMSQPHTPPQETSLPFSHPFFWSPYVLVGEGNAKTEHHYHQT